MLYPPGHDTAEGMMKGSRKGKGECGLNNSDPAALPYSSGKKEKYGNKISSKKAHHLIGYRTETFIFFF